LHNGEVPRTSGHRTDRVEPLLGDDATEVPHRHGVLTRDAAASERHAPLAGGVDLVEYMFLVAGRMRANAPRLTRPTTEQCGRLLTPKTAGRESYRQADGAAGKSNGQGLPPLWGAPPNGLALSWGHGARRRKVAKAEALEPSGGQTHFSFQCSRPSAARY
jgi:hypothetical protein